MKVQSIRWLLGVTWLLGVSWCGPVAGGIITNGDFETGDLTGWNVANQALSNGGFGVTDQTILPLSGSSTVGANSGTYYAVSDQDSPPGAASALYQAFTIPGPVTQATLTFSMFINDSGNSGPLGSGLDYGTPNSQYARVDILKGSVTDFLTTNAADIVWSDTTLGATDYVSVSPNGYTLYSIPIDGIFGGGGNFFLRFAEVNNLSVLNVGLDDVQITTAVPEPGSLMLCLSLVGAGAAARWHRRRKERRECSAAGQA